MCDGGEMEEIFIIYVHCICVYLNIVQLKDS